MSDIIDDAQAREAQYLAVCLANARASPPAAPQERDAEALRMPVSWDAVAAFNAMTAARAAQSPAE